MPGKKYLTKTGRLRIDGGLIDRLIGHDIKDNHQVSIIFAVTDMTKTKAFLQSKDLKDKMEKAG